MKLVLSRSKHSSSDGFTWKCRKMMNGVRHEVERSIRSGSWLEDCNLTLEECIKQIYMWSCDYSQKQERHELRISSSTAVAFDRRCREVCEVVCIRCSEKIGGPGIVVEIDETKVGKRKYSRGHMVEGQWVFGGSEHKTTGDSRNCFMVPVEDRKADTLLPILQRYVAQGSIVMSDCWKAYWGISDLEYEHLTVNHSENYKDPNTGACTNTIEGSWRHMKRSLPISVRKGDYCPYLAEYLWRRKHKGTDWDLFMQFCKDLGNHFACQ